VALFFDNISHHGLMNRIRRRIGENKINRLILAFLKAGHMSELQFNRTEAGTPQGGILSPLLANIALGIIEERYTRHVWPRQNPDGTVLTDPTSIKKRAIKARTYDKSVGKTVCFPVRYADDFIILVHVPEGPNQKVRAIKAAEQEKTELARLLRNEMGLELSESKTKITPVTSPMSFLGFTIRVQYNPKSRWISKLVIPKSKSHKIRQAIKDIFKSNTLSKSLQNRLTKLNLLLRGWGYSYRHAWKAKRVFNSIDNYIWHTIFGWLKKKHNGKGTKYLHRLYKKRIPGRKATVWTQGGVSPFRLSSIQVFRFKHGWIIPPKYALTFAESPVHIERCTPGSEEGAPETAR
jgi:RNA-directed DNA polymerase